MSKQDEILKVVLANQKTLGSVETTLNTHDARTATNAKKIRRLTLAAYFLGGVLVGNSVDIIDVIKKFFIG